MLDLFCGRWGWSKAFAARKWECRGIDLTKPPLIPDLCVWIYGDVLTVDADYLRSFDFICASPPCEQFSVHGMKHFHPNPPYPELGIKLFEHTRRICEESGVPYVIENVRAAQQFVGNAVHHCGPFYLWGTGVPPLVGQGLKKMTRNNGSMYKSVSHLPYKEMRKIMREHEATYGGRQNAAATAATIPPELANCVADYAERILEPVRLMEGQK
jgi:C-5 cytosine-specific DNA methylase